MKQTNTLIQSSPSTLTFEVIMQRSRMMLSLLSLCSLSVLSSNVYAQSQPDMEKVFPDPITSAYGGNVNLNNNIILKGGDNKLNFDNVSDNARNGACNVGQTKCTKQSGRAASINLPTFITASGNNQKTVSSNETFSASQSYNQITVNRNQKLKLSISGSDKNLAIRNLTLNSGSQLELDNGVYHIENLKVYDSHIKLKTRSTKVVLYVKNMTVESANLNNASIEQNFGIIVLESVNFSGDVDIDGFIFSPNNVNINSGDFNQEGATSAKNLNLNGTVFIDYDVSRVRKIELFDFDEPTVTPSGDPELIGHWPLDICPTDGSNTIPDIVGNNDAIAKSGSSIENDGKFCQSGRLNGTGAHIYIPDAPHLRGDYGTFSFWFKVDDLEYEHEKSHGGQYLFSRDSLDKDLGGHLTSWIDDDGAVHLRYQTNNQDHFIESDEDVIREDRWHFYAVTWNNDTTKLYIDNKMVGENRNATGSQRNNPEPMVFGGNARRSSQAETTPSDLRDFFRGNIDDIRWYNKHMEKNELNQLRNAKGYDCTACGPVTDEELVAEYRFADQSWGNPGDIQDTSGNAFHATLSGETRLLTPVNNMSCGTLDIPPNTDQATPDFIDTPIDLETDVGDKGTLSFWFKSNSGWQDERDRTLFDAVQISQSSTKHAGNKYFYLQLLENGSLTFGHEDSTDRDLRFFSESYDFPEFTWVHIAITYNYETGIPELYLNGIKRTFTIGNSDKNNNNLANWNGIMPDYGNIAFADNRTDYITASSSANGRYDDIRVYNFVQDAAEIQADMEKADSCAVLYGYKIEHPDRALTCESAPVTVKACKNEDCSELYEHTVQVSLSPSPNGDPAGQVYEFEREFTFDLVSREAGTKDIVFSPMYHAKAEELVNTCTNNCQIEFVNAGLQIYENRPGTYTSDASLVNQMTAIGRVAGMPLNDIYMRAVRDNNGVCEALLAGEQDVAISHSCEGKGPLGLINGCAVPFGNLPINRNVRYKTSTTTMTFDENAVTNFGNFSFADVADVKFRASMKVDGAVLESNTMFIEFTPDGIQLSNDIVGDHVAGDPFLFRIKAYGYNNIELPSYQPDNMTLYAERVAPVNGPAYGLFKLDDTFEISSAPGFNLLLQPLSLIGANPMQFTNGEKVFSDAMYSDVGALEVYLVDQHGKRTITSNTLRIGPFVPAYFGVQEVYSPMFDHASSGAFTYVGQPFFFDISALPQLEVTAYNAIGQVVNNYDSSEWKLFPTATQTQSQVSYSDVSGSGLSLSLATTPTTPTLSERGDFDGKAKITLNNIALEYAKTATPVDAFQTGVDVVLDKDFLTDANGTCYQQTYPNGCSDFTFANVSGTEQRYGRLNLTNAYGPENEALYIPIQAQYFAGGNWLLNNDDNSTNISILQSAGQLTLTNLPDSETDITSLFTGIGSNGFLNGGQSDATDLLFPAANQRGAMRINISPTVGSPDWAIFLNYDWNGDGVINASDVPSATINFGVFRGNDRKINFREVLE